MAEKSDNPFKFWEELKRRKVVRVITVYAAAAFVILELVDIVAPSLGLPAWTLNLIIILLCVGLILSIILSWVYDITPEGVQKTKPVSNQTEINKEKTSNTLVWKIATYTSFVVIVGFLMINIFNRKKQTQELDKSIAVLPFKNDSPDQERMYFINGTMEAILNNLCKIEDLRVPGRTSVEQYRDNPKPISVVADEMNVSYVLEGSGHRDGDNVRLFVQLLDGREDKHIWSKSYDADIKEIFSMQSEIAQMIALEIKAVITPEEKQQIESIPTNNLEAYDYYLLAKHYVKNHTLDEDFWTAIEYYKKAVALDTTFALAYSGLAEVYYELVNYGIISPKEALPEASRFCNMALQINENLAEAYCMLGLIKQSFEYDLEGSEKEYLKALEIDPGNYYAHRYYSKFLSLMKRHDEAITHSNAALEIEPLSPRAISSKIRILYHAGYENEAIKLLTEVRDSLSNQPYFFWASAIIYADQGRYDDALKMLHTQLNLMGKDNISDEISLMGYIYGKLGQKGKAMNKLYQLDSLASEGFYIAPRTYIWIYIGINDLDKAFAVLEQSIEDHTIGLLSFRRYPITFKEDPRFVRLAKEVGLLK